MASLGGAYMPHLYRTLQAAHIDKELALSAVSFSLSRQTTEAEIRRAISIVQEAVTYYQQTYSGVL